MKLVDLSITEFAKVLGSDAPAPGEALLLPYLLQMGFPYKNGL